MKRDDAISVLKELTGACESFRNVQTVSLTMDKERKNWILKVNWVPQEMENGTLDRILADYDLEVATIKGHTVFRSRRTIKLSL